MGNADFMKGSGYNFVMIAQFARHTRPRISLLSTLTFLLAVFAATSVSAQVDKPSDDKIIIGSILPLSGANEADGVRRLAGTKAYEKRINASGGIHGRKLEFIYVDGKFDPKTSIDLAKKLIEKDGAFALVNVVGTPIATGLMPILERMNVPFFAPITGGDFIRTPVRKSIFVVRPSFIDEARALISHAVETLKIRDIGLFYRDDSLGMVGRKGIVQALDRYGLRPSVVASHHQSDTSTEAGLKEILKTKPKVIVLWTLSTMAVDFIKRAHAQGYKPLILAPSPVIPTDVIATGGAAVEGAVFASGFPSETDTSIPIVKEFRADMTAAGYKPEEINSFAFEAYFNCAVLGESLRRSGRALSREKLYKTLEAMTDVSIGGLKVSFAPENHQALYKVYLTTIKDGKEIPIAPN